MGKRIFVLGGAGWIGSECARDLLFSEEIEEVVIGDYDLDKANRLAKELNDERVKVVKVDVTKEDETSEKVMDYDLLMNCTSFVFFRMHLTWPSRRMLITQT